MKDNNHSPNTAANNCLQAKHSIDIDHLQLLVFDADDTLWDCQSHFDEVMNRCARMLKPYVSPDKVADQLYATERANMPLMGYGTKAFTISLLENALRVSNYKVPADIVEKILQMGKELLLLPATPLEGVEKTLAHIRESHRWKMVMFTKGESLDQKGKISRSGLSSFFDDIIIVDDKTDNEYSKVCERHSASPEEMLMIGNSFRSDIAPALRIGANAVHIPFHTTWALEHAETFEHEHLVTLSSFSELEQFLL